MGDEHLSIKRRNHCGEKSYCSLWRGSAARPTEWARGASAERVSEWANGRRKKQREEGILWMPVQWPWCVVSARLIITGLLCHLMLEISWIQNKSMESRSRRGRRRAEQHSRLGAFLLGRAAHCCRVDQRNLFGTFAPRRSAHCDPLRFCIYTFAPRVWSWRRSSGHWREGITIAPLWSPCDAFFVL